MCSNAVDSRQCMPTASLSVYFLFECPALFQQRLYGCCRNCSHRSLWVYLLVVSLLPYRSHHCLRFYFHSISPYESRKSIHPIDSSVWFAPQNATWEGDNAVLSLQTARFLIKALLAAREGTSPTASAAYVGDTTVEASRRCRAKDTSQWLDSDVQLDALR